MKNLTSLLVLSGGSAQAFFSFLIRQMQVLASRGGNAKRKGTDVSHMTLHWNFSCFLYGQEETLTLCYLSKYLQGGPCQISHSPLRFAMVLDSAGGSCLWDHWSCPFRYSPGGLRVFCCPAHLQSSAQCCRFLQSFTGVVLKHWVSKINSINFIISEW